MGLVVLVVPLPVRNPAAAHTVRTGRTILMVPLPAEDLDLMTGGMVSSVLMALGQMAREGQRVARPLRKGGNLDQIANQISKTRRDISKTRRDSAGATACWDRAAIRVSTLSVSAARRAFALKR
jgi:hypothetical protein